ncbi:receptor-like protein Cf-9 [Morus notabilis]|uniref:receptor-like protein Cf-9 n=1 Tax=Morus notabilis TaxID=981085 RepID=UPI000CECEBA0|nr:receptor-like protein Cf-9 [Morus notabilis]
MIVWFPLLCLLSLSLPSSLHSSSFLPSPFARPPPQCHPHESSALLQFKNSFSTVIDSSYFYVCDNFYGFANPNSTTSWVTGRSCCTWSGVTCDEETGHVIRLDLGCSGLEGIIDSDSALFSLTHLQTLILFNNYFVGSEISPKFGAFVSMTHLDLSYTGFSGQVPLKISHLSSLVTLNLSQNYDLSLDSYSLKQIVTNLTSLRELSLGGVNMSYVSPNSSLNFSASLVSLDISYSGLTGEFPENIFHLPNVQELRLSHNENLTGSIPRYNWTGPLRYLSLSSTRFSIDLPYVIRNLKHLDHLDVNNCNLKGSFPALSSNITQITSLELSSNHFDGQIPWGFVNMRKLSFLDLSNNNFKGELLQICNSTNKTFLCESSKDQLVGPVPLHLESLFLHGNFLNGTIPSWLYSHPSLQNLHLDHNQFTGHIGEFQYNSLVNLGLSSNKLQGLIPSSIFQQVNLLG